MLRMMRMFRWFRANRRRHRDGWVAQVENMNDMELSELEGLRDEFMRSHGLFQVPRRARRPDDKDFFDFPT
jgi:hypothetical protein